MNNYFTGPAVANNQTADIGLTTKEIQKYSIMDAIRAQAYPGDAAIQRQSGFVRECSAAVEQKSGRVAKGIMIPSDVLTRDHTVGTDSGGGYLVGTDHRPQSFIDLLRARITVLAMGAKEMGGLVGNVSIPRKTAGHTGYWVAEDGAVTESAMTLGQLNLSPKTVGAYSDISRQLSLQSSPDVELMVRRDIAATLGSAIDLAALHGTGADNQPTGLAETSGIGSVVGGTNGLAPTHVHMVALESAVAEANADVRTCGYLTNAKVRGALRQTFPNSTGGSIPVWTDGAAMGEGTVNGYKALVTNQVASDLDKGTSTGVCSGVFYGDWSNLLIAMWGGLDILADPYSLSTTGQIRVVGFQSVDIGVRHAESFSYMADALTA